LRNQAHRRQDVCDKVTGNESGFVGISNQAPSSKLLTELHGRAKDVVAAMIKRLAHRNANVQLYTLEVGQELLKLQNKSDIRLLAWERLISELRPSYAP
jgi:hypothetical protein